MKTLKKVFLLVIIIFAANKTVAQNTGLISGPMLGYVAHREAMIWLEVSPNVRNINIEYWIKNDSSLHLQKTVQLPSGQSYYPTKIVIENLAMNTEYQYQIKLDANTLHFDYPTTFKTKELWEWRKDAPDFSFLFGSCVYLNDTPYDRPGKPYGKKTNILESMAEVATDFMLWNGDNLYLREADYSSASGMRYRYSHDFATPQMQRLRATRCNFAIWDDHDYGPNNSDRNFQFKNISTEIFKQYWCNPTFGDGNEGIYTKINWSDCDFFLMDDRSFRTPDDYPDSISGKPNPDKYIYGAKQMQWLKDGLMMSNATFKFIVNGGQILNPMMADPESLRHFPAEFDELIDFINNYKINGIFFLTGDRHFTEMIKIQPKGMYPLYDFTCSPITSSAYDIREKKEGNNPDRVDGTLVVVNNFSKISVIGKKGERILQIETFDENGKRQWIQQIAAANLRF